VCRARNAAKLPTRAPAEEHSTPVTAAMMNSKGHRLCEVGSFAVSTAIRASIGAGTATPIARITAMKRALPKARPSHRGSANRKTHCEEADHEGSDQPECGPKRHAISHACFQRMPQSML